MNILDKVAVETHAVLIDEALQKLRCHLIGGGIPCLPSMRQTTRAEQIRHITSTAAQITFCYAVVNQKAPPAELRACRTLTCAILVYLLVATNANEHTFDSFLLLLHIDRHTLLRMLMNTRWCPHRLRHFLRNGIAALHGNAVLTGNLERTLLLFLQQQKRLPNIAALRLKLDALGA